ncbi:ornithine cyclodeaminase [compost metagenome]
MMKLVLEIGVERFVKGLATYIEEDFRRWESFDKTPRAAKPASANVEGFKVNPFGHNVSSQVSIDQ